MPRPVDYINAVRDDRTYKGAVKAILYAFATRVDGEGIAWPSLQRLADEAGVSLNSAKRAVKQLEQDGVLTPTGATMPSRQGSPVPVKRMVLATLAKGATEAKGTTLAPSKGATVAPELPNTTTHELLSTSGFPLRGTPTYLKEGERTRQVQRLREKTGAPDDAGVWEPWTPPPPEKCSVPGCSKGKGDNPAGQCVMHWASRPDAW